jgi:hypothetical protein
VTSNRSRLFILSTLAAALLLLAVAPSPAEAQRRYRRPAPVVVIGGFGYYSYWRHDPWYQWGPYGYPGYRYGIRDAVASLRIDAEPRQAQVFVDGYYAGLVDDFDGIFQRLRVEPGGRVITLYLEGYRTEEQRLYLRPGTDQRVRLTMEPLGAGERAVAPALSADEDLAERFDEPALPIERGRPGADQVGPAVRPAPVAFGTLALRVQPSDAEILIDGERWSGSGRGIFSVELPEGRHQVEVRRAGLTAYTEDVLIQRGRTLTLNVSLR